METASAQQQPVLVTCSCEYYWHHPKEHDASCPVTLAQGLNSERYRLQQEIVEAAKKWVGFYNGSSEFFSDTKLAEAVQALIHFESSQRKT